MKKTEIRVTIDSEEKQQRAIEILERYGEEIYPSPLAMDFDTNYINLVRTDKFGWYVGSINFWNDSRTEITLNELEEMLKNENK